MTSPTKKPGQFNSQTLLIGAGASIVVFLTILAAFFLARNDIASGGGTATPTELIINPGAVTPEPVQPTPTNTVLLPAATPTLHTPLPATVTPTPLPTTATFTPLPGTPTPTTFVPTPTFTVSPTFRPPTQTPIPCGPPPNWVVYIVQPGDTVFSLAARTGISDEALRFANCLRNNNIRVGQQLYLPFVPPTLTPTATTQPPTPTDTPTPTATTFVTDTPTFTPTPTATFAPPPDTPTPTPTPPDVSLGTPTPTLSPTLPVVIPTETPTAGGG
jgi:LysM repeat protein